MNKLWLLYSLLTILTWGIYGFVVKLAERTFSPWTIFVIAGAPFAILVVFLSIVVPGLRPQWQATGGVFVILTGLAGWLGTLFFFLALQQGKASLIVPLIALYPLVTVLLGLLFLQEKLLPIHWVGVALALIAGILLSR